MKNNEKNFIGDINKELKEIEKLDILEEIEESLLTICPWSNRSSW